MTRQLVWIEEPGFGGFGCSECGWRFEPSDASAGTTFEDLTVNLGLQLDQEFASHVCADHPKADHPKKVS
jgi:hypothetical protein